MYVKQQKRANDATSLRISCDFQPRHRRCGKYNEEDKKVLQGEGEMYERRSEGYEGGKNTVKKIDTINNF